MTQRQAHSAVNMNVSLKKLRGSDMTIVPMIKKCPKCHKKYSWNPDVGKMNCPYCHGLGTPMSNLVDKILDKKKKTSAE